MKRISLFFQRGLSLALLALVLGTGVAQANDGRPLKVTLYGAGSTVHALVFPFAPTSYYIGSGEPLRNLPLKVYDASRINVLANSIDAKNGPMSTDLSGSFSAQVDFVDSAGKIGWRDRTIVLGNAELGAYTPAFTLPLDTTDSGVTGYYMTRGPIRVRVKSGSDPLPGVPVSLRATGASIPPGFIPLTKTTDENGMVEWPGMLATPNGQVVSSSPFSVYTYVAEVQSTTGLSFQNGSINVRPFQSWPEGATISVSAAPIGGVITNALGTPLSQHPVTIHEDSWSGTVVDSSASTATMRTDNNGRYSSRLLPTGRNYFVRPATTHAGGEFTFSPDPQPVQAGRSTVNYTVNTGPVTGRALSGAAARTMGVGSQVAGVRFTLYRGTTVVKSVDTGNDGTFNLAGVEAGTFRLVPSKAHVSFDPPEWNAQLGQVSLIFGTLFKIAGKVTDSTGRPVPNVTVLVSTNKGASPTNQAALPVITSALGDYSIEGLFDDGVTYRVSASGASLTLTPSRSVQFNLNGNSVVDMNFIAAASVAGHVTRDGTNGVAGITITGVAEGGGTTRTATTDANGNYQLTGFPNGINIEVTPSSADYRFNLAKRTVGTGALNVDFIATGYIKGRVTFANGGGVPSITVMAQSVGLVVPVRESVITDSQGYFAHTNLANGTWLITPSTEDGFSFDTPSLTRSTGVDGVNFRVTQSPPTISPINDQFLGRVSVSPALGFVVTDREQQVLTVSAESSDVLIVHPTNGVALASQTPTNWTVQIASGAKSGTARVKLRVRDGVGGSAVTEFLVNVDVQPEYRILEMPEPVGTTEANNKGINDSGMMVGIVSINAQWYGYVHTPYGVNGVTDIRGQTRLIATNGVNLVGWPRAINNLGVVVGSDWIYDQNRAVTFGSLGLSGCNNNWVMGGINNLNQFTAYSPWDTCNFNYAVTLSPTNIGQMLASREQASLLPYWYRINNRSQVLAFDKSGRVFTTTAAPGVPMVQVGTRTDLVSGNFPALFLNDQGSIVGQLASGVTYLTDTNGTNLIEIKLPGGGLSAPGGINNRGQVVGTANTHRGTRLFLYQGGQAFDLNDVISASDAAVWRLHYGDGINDSGEIAGTGTKDGRFRSFRAVPAVVAGKSVAAPALAVARAPQWTILEKPAGQADFPDSSYFYWSEADQRLFALAGDITARVSWPTNSNLTDPGRFVTIVHTVWPREPQRHVIGAPVEVEPSSVANFPYRFHAVPFTTASGAVDSGTRTFNASFNGWSVLQYHQTDGASLNPVRQRVYFEVVNSDVWDSAVFGRVEKPWEIGQAIAPNNAPARTVFTPAGPGNDFEVVARQLGAQFNGLTVQFESAPGLGARVVATNIGQTLSVRLNPASNNVTSAEVVNAINAIAEFGYLARLANNEVGTGAVSAGGANLRFNGTNTHVMTPDLTTWFRASTSPLDDFFQSLGIEYLGNQLPMTLELWFKPEAAGVIVSEQGTAATNGGWRYSAIEIQPSGQVQARVWGLPPITLGTANFNEWNHVALRYRPDASIDFGNAYEPSLLDGVLNGEPSAAQGQGTRLTPWTDAVGQQFRFGIGLGTDQNNGSGHSFRGQIRDVRLWAYALDDATVSFYMNAAPVGNETPLVAWYKLTDGVGAVAADSAVAHTVAGQTMGPGGNAAIGGTTLWQILGLPESRTTIGGSLEHNDYPGRNGFVLFEKAFYDGEGADRAHDRNSRRGPIIPVNKGTLKTATPENQMVVAWYHKNALGVSWADRPVKYLPDWPTSAEKIIIAGLKDAPLVTSAAYPSARIYNQPDRAQPGFNPNEEHALLIDGRIVALRDDLNSFLDFSRAHALLKYRDPFTQEWRFKVFPVQAEDATRTFRYDWTAGLEIQPPYPLNLLPLCAQSASGSGPIFEDYNGKFYAYAAGPGQSATNATIRYWYRLQSGFYYDLDENGVNDRVAGDCVAWLDRRAEGALASPNQLQGATDVPIQVNYTIRWPSEIPTLTVGDTLLNARNGLPDIFNQAAASVIFEGVNPALYNPAVTGASPLDSGVRLYDPLSERSVSLPAAYVPVPLDDLQAEGQRQLFTKLPFHIKTRLLFDSQQRTLSFRGTQIYRDQPEGSPLLLPNVMDDAERTNILALAIGDQIWETAVKNLYDLTRNPNRLSLDGDGDADKRLLVGLRGTSTNSVTLVQSGGPVAETLGNGPKALTAALPLSDTAAGRLWTGGTRPGVLQLDGVNDRVEVPHAAELNAYPLTISTWIRTSETNSSSQGAIVNKYASSSFSGYNLFVAGGRVQAWYFRTSGDHVYNGMDGGFIADGKWHHITLTIDSTGGKIFVDGTNRTAGTAAPWTGTPGPTTTTAPLNIGYYLSAPAPAHFNGQIADVQIWNVSRTVDQIRADKDRALVGNEPGLVAYWRLNDGSGTTAADSTASPLPGTLNGGPTWQPTEHPFAQANGYVTLAFNNDPLLGGLPVTLKIIRIDCASGVFQGDIRVLPADNVFDERLTLRHSGDFGLEPQNFDFEWYYRPGGESYPILNTNGNGARNVEWQLYRAGRGLNTLTLGTGGESGILTITDNRWIVRYRGYTNACGTNWGNYAGAPGIIPTISQLADGWIKRVTTALNPFDSRTLDFRNSPVNTFVSLLVAAGRRYEGDIAFNPDSGNVNAIGLIETYETVLRRGRGLSTDVGFNVAAANDALLHAASKVSSLYTLLGNEAFFDQQDPTIGFTTADGTVGSLAPSLFAFQNQTDSLLEEELALLRGRDENRGAPVYNRLPPNFTGGEGQIAYRQTYNITDAEPRDGFINEQDASRLFPQGHGDAWGHYLTALTTYYKLLRETNFVWMPRTEQVLLSGAPIEVDFEDERKFAAAAAAKSRAGAEIAALTHRQKYTGDATGQWQGYKDTDTDRAWGVTEWSRRAGQGAYFDWVAANALLPSVDSTHVGIQKIDRTTVAELKEIVANHSAVQSQEDSANLGLNPLGVTDGMVPFDIDPTFLDVGSTAQVGQEAVQGLGHFEQIAQRALKTLNNAVGVFNHANSLSQNLRRTQDTAADFSANVADQERDYDNRLIEIFGYPYAGTKGPGKVYASSYNGPDLVYFNYVDASDLTGDTTPDAAPGVTALLKGAQGQIASIPDSTLPALATVSVTYPLKDRGWRFTAPTTWGSRRAPGAVQGAISELLQAQGNLIQELDSYDGLLQDIRARVALLKAKHGLQEDQINLMNRRRNTLMGMNAAIGAMRATHLTLRSAADNIRTLTDDSIQALPSIAGFSFDISAPIRAVLLLAEKPLLTTIESSALTAEIAENAVELSKENTALETDIQLQVNDNRYEIRQAVAELESLMRNESTQRIGLYTLKEAVAQALGRYKSELAAGLRLLDERDAFRKRTAARVADARYSDATFRIFRNDAIQKYRAAFDLAARYVYVAATAYDFETTFLGSHTGAGQQFLADIVRQRALGEVIDGAPIAGRHGLADAMARLMQNFDVLKPSLGFNNPQLEQGQFSLRNELFREKDGSTLADEAWRDALAKHRVDDLWSVPEFRRYCRPFAPAPEQGGPAQPGLVIPFSTTVTFGLNHFGWPLAGGDGSYDASRFSTKIRSVGTSFSGYPTNNDGGLGLSRTPRIYFIPVGTDILRAAAGNVFETREFKLVDQKIPVPFPIGNSDLNNPGWIPQNDSLSGTFIDLRRYSSYLATSDTTFDEENTTTDSRLIGRSVWNTRWLLIIPGGTLLNDPSAGLDRFVADVSDITLYFSTYSFGGN